MLAIDIAYMLNMTFPPLWSRYDKFYLEGGDLVTYVDPDENIADREYYWSKTCYYWRGLHIATRVSHFSPSPKEIDAGEKQDTKCGILRP